MIRMSDVDDAIERAEEFGWADDNRQIFRTAALLAAEVKRLRARLERMNAQRHGSLGPDAPILTDHSIWSDDRAAPPRRGVPNPYEPEENW